MKKMIVVALASLMLSACIKEYPPEDANSVSYRLNGTGLLAVEFTPKSDQGVRCIKMDASMSCWYISSREE